MKEKTFIDACIDGDLKTFKLGLRSHNPANDKLLSLRMACEWGNIDVIKLLMIDERVDPSAHRNIALVHAAESDKPRAMLTLMQDDRVVAGCIKYDQPFVNEEDQQRIFEEKPHLLV